MSAKTVEDVALAQALEKLHALRVAGDPHLFARFNTEDATALLAERDALSATVARLERELREAREFLLINIDRSKFMNRPPCYICGYNGPGYFDPRKHKCAAHYHAAIDRAVESQHGQG